MGVAARAADALAHEDEGGGLAKRPRIFTGHGADEVRRTHAEIAARRGEEFARELVVGLVGLQAVVYPLVIDGDGFGPDAYRVLAFDAQEVAPFERPEIVELVAGQEGVDEAGAVGLGQEGARLVGRREQADYVEVGSAQEDFVGRDAGGRHPHGSELLVNELVNSVAARRGWERLGT